MNKTKAVILTILVLIACIVLATALFPFQKDKAFEKPKWVKEIQQKVDFNQCSASNCEACDQDLCLDFPDSCSVQYQLYSCGPACDASIAYCIKNE